MTLLTTSGGSEDDVRFMRRALELAQRGWGRTSPNPMVGAVIVQGGEVVGEGWHAEFGGPHAEVVALGAAGERARGATAYVTLEPCNHHGKTPPCSDALRAAGIARVVTAVEDPHPRAGGGAGHLRAHGIQVEVGVERDAAQELNAWFFHAQRSDRPFVTLKLAVSLDGAIADHTRRMAWLTGAEARAEVHRLRAASDAVAVGVGTVLADDPVLTVRDAPDGIVPRVPPARVVFDRQLRIPIDSKLVQGARELSTLVVHAPGAQGHVRELLDAGIRLVPAESPADALRGLRKEGVASLLVEGGAGLAGSLLEAGLVDRLIIFRAPLVLGGGALNAFSAVSGRSVAGALRWQVIRRATFGPDLMTVYAPVSQAGD